MDNLYYHLLLFLVISCGLNAQTQLSFIDNQVPISKLRANGIVNVNGSEYLIETDQYNLRVSELKNDSLQLLYSVSDFPFNDQLSSGHGKLNTRSGFLTDDVFLYEIFKNQIRKRNILTSEIVDSYFLPESVNWFFIDIDVIGEIIHIQLNESTEFVTLNTATHEITFLPFSSSGTIRLGQNYYTFTAGGGVSQYNSIDKTTISNFEDEASPYFGSNSTLNNQRGLIFGGSQQTRFISEDTTFLLDCIFNSPFVDNVNIHETEDHYIAFYNDLNKTTIRIIRKDDCSIHSTKVVDFNTNAQNINIYDSPVLNNEYLLFKIEDNSDHPDSIYIFDREDLGISTIPIENVQKIYTHSFYRSGDELYFIGEDKTAFLPIDKLYSINLETKEFQTRIEGYEYDEPISFSSSETDSTFLILDRYFEPGPLNMLKFYSGSHFKEIENGHITRNIGIIPNQYLAVDNDKLAFHLKDELYVADNSIANPNKTYKIGLAADEISKLLIENNKLHGLINKNDSSFYFTYNLNSEELSLDPLAENIPLDGDSYVMSNYIFGDFSIKNKVYFDLESKSIKPIQIADAIDTMYRSQDAILFVSNCDDRYCLTRFDDGEYIDLPTTYAEEPKIFSKQNGAFMIMNTLSEDQYRITILDKDGSLGDQIEVSGTLIPTNQETLENGPLSALMFYNIATEDLEVIMHRDDDFQSFTVPYIYALWDNIIWYKAENSLIIKSYDIYDPGIYVLTLNKEAKRLDINDPNYSVYDLHIATSNNGICTIVAGSFVHGVEIIEYNIETEMLNRKNVEYSDYLNSASTLNSIFRLSTSIHLVTFTSYIGNSEPYILDTKNLTLTQLTDLNSINQFSNPHQFIESPTHLYFTARSPQDNSYQLFSMHKEDITSVNNQKKYSSILHVYPNPATDMISIDLAADHMNIINNLGQVVQQLGPTAVNQSIDISNLLQGLYFIEAVNDNKKTTSTFIKN